jgi:hypothetical protein
MINEKVCSICQEIKPLSFFNNHKTTLDGLRYLCKQCEKIARKNYLRTKKGLVSQIYATQRKSSKKRGHQNPSYVNSELYKWMISQVNFEELYLNWIKSDYSKDLRPSVDRLDDYKGYSLSNIRLITWIENNNKGYRDSKNGINNKGSRSVIQLSLDNEILGDFYSMTIAGKTLSVSLGNINSCCNNKRKTAGGFKWKYKYPNKN